VKARRVLIGGSSVLLGVAFLCAAFVWWTVSGISAIDSPDGEPSGPLHGYGVLAAIVVPGLALLFVGIRRLGREQT
jgi:hypothetical protein